MIANINDFKNLIFKDCVAQSETEKFHWKDETEVLMHAEYIPRRFQDFKKA